MRLRVTTAGESHGRGMIAVISGLPAGLQIDKSLIDAELSRRQRGYGRGERMKIEADAADVLSGIRHGRTIGSPVTVVVWNRDWQNWQEDMAAWLEAGQQPTRAAVRKPRPGHADLAGLYKYGLFDIRDILERASARETAARVAAGAICKQLLAEFGITIRSQVLRIGTVEASPADLSDEQTWQRVEDSPVRCADERASELMCREIDMAREEGDSLGGVGEVVAFGVPPGLGSYASWEERIDAALAWAVMSIPSVKAVEIGDGWTCAEKPGSQVHDEIILDQRRPWGIGRGSNRAGGVEGGITNGEPVVVRAAFKPIPTLRKPLASVNLDTGQSEEAHAERADVCIVPAGCVVAEAMVAIVFGDFLLRKFGGDHIEDVKQAYQAYLKRLSDMVRGDEAT